MAARACVGYKNALYLLIEIYRFFVFFFFLFIKHYNITIEKKKNTALDFFL